MKPSLCLNMIVKNEAARMERCLRSVLPYVKYAAIYDTGSTDDTREIAHRLCEEFKVPLAWGTGEFRNFSQARNEAFRFAKAFHNGAWPWCQFALLMDADMELVVDDPTAFDGLRADAPAYDMMQKAGSVSYANRRLVNMDVGNPDIYVGVTHEYIDVPSVALIDGARFTDHADGANRPGKFQRDVELLEEGLKAEPQNGRYWYYLGNSYRDWAQTEPQVRPLAIDAYTTRIEMGGWDEEIHSAMMNRAECYRDGKDEAGFVSAMLEAYNFRPQRAEPLYELAKYYREKGQNSTATLFAKHGARLSRPDDVLFVNDFVYEHGLRYEYAVAGYYDERERYGALQITDDLALDPTCPPEYRGSARSNLYWFTQPLAEHCPSFKPKKLDVTCPEGYTAMNPSVTNGPLGGLICNVRTVNYKIDEHGRYMIGPKECNDAPIDTRNFVCRLDHNLEPLDQQEVIWHRPQAQWNMVTGLEDIRLFWHGGLCFSACVREQNPGGYCMQWFGRLDEDDKDPNFARAHSDYPISQDNATEKNWMPWVHDDVVDFMYRLNTVVHLDGGEIVTVHPTKLHVNDISGSSQLIPFKEGYLAVTHEASTGPDGKRTYWHRFVWFTKDGELRRVSLPFVFLGRQIEFCAGLAYHPRGNDLVLSFGVRDAEPWVATVNIEEVAAMIWKFHES